MTCKDCIHYDVCEIRKKSITADPIRCGYKCPHFEDTSKLVKLPCIAMVEQFIKDGKFDKKHTAHNGKIAVVYIDKSKWNSPLIDITEKFYNTDKAYERMQVLKDREKNDTRTKN